MFFNFFKKKKEELSDQLAVYLERGDPRWGAPHVKLNAGLSIDGFEGEGQLGNVSISGCSMLSITYVSITPNNVYQVKVIPGPEDNMGPFALKLKLNWTKSSETLFLAGFSLKEGEDCSQLKRYVEVLRSCGLIPDYGNMSLDRR